MTQINPTTGRQKRDKNAPIDAEQRDAIASTPVDADAAYDPEYSLGASINESVMAPQMTTEESRSVDFDSQDAMRSTSSADRGANDFGRVAHDGLDSDLGAPEGATGAGMLSQDTGMTGSDQSLQSGATTEGREGTSGTMERLRGKLNESGQNLRQAVDKGQQNLREGWQQVSGDLKARGSQLDKNIKAKPYGFVLGAVGVGFALGRMTANGRHKDL